MIKNYYLKIIKVDNDGTSLAEIYSENKNQYKQILIPFKKNNYVFKQGDVVSAIIKIKKKKIVDVTILKKINIKKSFFGIIKVITNEFLEIENLLSKDNIKYFVPNNKSKSAIYKIGNLVKLKEIINQRFSKKKIYDIEKIYPNFNSSNFFPLLAIEELGITTNFPKQVLDELNKVELIKNGIRKNLSSLPIITIDGIDAKDFDDAVYAEKIQNNNWKVIVSIADVSHFVCENSKIDEHAQKRGNSVYFPNLVIPMLPEKLSNDICSLIPNKNRLCLTVEIILDPNGNKISHKFYKSIIKSKKRFTYEEIEKFIASNFKKKKSVDNEILLNIQNLYQVYIKRKLLSEKRGALNINLSEKKILFNNLYKPLEIQKVAQLQSHQLIEELMILANVCAAEELIKFNKEIPFRVHEKPKVEKIFSLINSIGSPYDKILKNNKNLNGKVFNQILEKSFETKDFIKINELILRAQSQARYQTLNKGHFGLSLKNYIHFTSPIRRYSDLIVHRQISSILNDEFKKKFSMINLKEICQHISNTERKAISAERITLDRFTAFIYKNKIHKQYEGKITSIKNFGVFIQFDDFKSEGFIPKRFLPRDRYTYNDKTELLKGEMNIFKIGMNIRVSIKDSNIIKGKILLDFVKYI